MNSLFIVNTSDSCEGGYRIDCDKYGDYDPIIFPTITLNVRFEKFTWGQLFSHSISQFAYLCDNEQLIL